MHEIDGFVEGVRVYHPRKEVYFDDYMIQKHGASFEDIKLDMESDGATEQEIGEAYETYYNEFIIWAKTNNLNIGIMYGRG